MTGAVECAEIRRALGVYVLGALEPAGRAAVDGHLAGCHDCREELAGLAGLPALLGRVPAAEAARLSPGEAGWASDADLPPGTALPGLLGRAARIRRARRCRGMLATAAALVIGVGGAMAAQRGVLHPAAPPASSQIAWKTVSARSHMTLVSATVSYAPEAWGTQLDVQVSGIRAGISCQLWVTSSGGQEVAAGGWTVAHGHLSAWYPASASFPAPSVRSFEVTAGGKILVTVLARSGLPPGGGPPRRECEGGWPRSPAQNRAGGKACLASVQGGNTSTAASHMWSSVSGDAACKQDRHRIGTREAAWYVSCSVALEAEPDWPPMRACSG